MMNSGIGNFGQTSHNEMMPINSIDFHHTNSNPQSNSRAQYIPPVSGQTGVPNKKQMKSRKGLNQSIDLKHNVMKSMRTSSQYGPGQGNTSFVGGSSHSRK